VTVSAAVSLRAIWTRSERRRHPSTVLVYAVVDDSLSPTRPLGVFVRRTDAERFVEEIRGDEPELAERLRIEERNLQTGALD
jgi:hypothetical protein